MALPVKLRVFVDYMDAVNDEMTAYINRNTGDLVILTDDDISFAEDDDTHFIPDWQRETVEKAKQVLIDDNYIELPDRFELHEYQIMERFCTTVEDRSVQNILLRAIRGRRAFRRFKDKVYAEGIDKDWYRFRDNAYKQIAADFLSSECIAFVDE